MNDMANALYYSLKTNLCRYTQMSLDGCFQFDY